MISMQQVKAVTFDVGGTLIEPWPSVGHVYVAEAKRYGAGAISPEKVNRQFRQAWRAAKNFRHTRQEWAALVDASFAGLTEVVPSQAFFAAVYDRFAEAGAWHIYPDVFPALQGLCQRGLRLGVVSNWDERLRPLLRALDLQQFFEVIVVSCEVGVPKPAPEMFQAACRGFGFAPAQVLHVGDSREMDLQGAESAGLRAVRINRGGGAGDDEINSLESLLQE